MLSDLLKEIEQKTQISPKWDDPNYLADLLLELGSYYATLGSQVAEADQEANLAESHYKVAREKRMVDLIAEGDTVGRAASQARVDSKDAEEEYIALHYKYKLLSLSRESLSVNIDVIRSKLSFVKKDMEN
jgi:hypothetical protein